MRLQLRPLLLTEYDDCDAAVGEILLVPEILVGS
jgi:hypothetical protein